MTRPSDSGSSRSPSAVEPLTSQTTTVTTLRAPRRCSATRKAPQLRQKRARSGFCSPQFAQVSMVPRSATVAPPPGRPGQGGPVPPVAGHHRHPAAGHRPQGGRAAPPLQQRHLAQDGPRADLGDLPAVPLHGQDTLEEEIELVAGLALLDQALAGRQAPERGGGGGGGGG